MADRKCDRCGEDVWTKVGPCGPCAKGSPLRNANLHQNANSTCKMTYAERMRITTRTPDKDGVWRAAPKWRDTDGY